MLQKCRALRANNYILLKLGSRKDTQKAILKMVELKLKQKLKLAKLAKAKSTVAKFSKKRLKLEKS